jgi:hypothetical protein
MLTSIDMPKTPPPPVLWSARVMSYAFVDDLEYRRWGALYVGDKLVEKVPRLAICLNLGKDSGPLLFHCDEEWEVLGTSGGNTIEATKERAEKNYPGVAERWVDVNTSIDDALRYYDAETGSAHCSFCKKRPFEIGNMLESDEATICEECVERFHRIFKDPVQEEQEEEGAT